MVFVETKFLLKHVLQDKTYLNNSLSKNLHQHVQ